MHPRAPGRTKFTALGDAPRPGPLLEPAFFERDALVVARALLGAYLRRGPVILRITEVEAYRWPDDSANHCRMGPTPRNAPMWGPPGRAYVYVCYGLHAMLNLVTGAVGEGAAVLIRACEPVAGLRVIQERRGGRAGPILLTGPGKVGQALALNPSWSHHPVVRRGGLTCLEGPVVADDQILVGPRVGIDYASPADRAAPWRLAIAGTPWVSVRRGLHPP
ncbi:MAG: DNA-3-methyladenine glycosylase [Nannocystaceae bacterium]